ncbi:hypothetical protein ACFVWT_18810 [Arthrobacter sp. NPDC058288]|uniref:hypothetical protein n=1 Tax=Arthrobacter sp. NPDC058288 TaxID=3346424 RepID=UPI0036E9C621
MSRPRKAEDPIRWPVPCARCGQHHQTVARWPDGGVCGYCYQQAKRTRGTCACGHEGVLPGMVDDQPACRRCSGVRLNIDCESCGAEDELHSRGRCWTCVLGNVVDDLLTDPVTGSMANELVPLAAALKSMKRANSGMTWIRQKHVTAFLRNLAVAPTITHETFDQLPDSRTREVACSRNMACSPDATNFEGATRTGLRKPLNGQPTPKTVSSSAATFAGTINAG